MKKTICIVSVALLAMLTIATSAFASQDISYEPTQSVYNVALDVDVSAIDVPVVGDLPNWCMSPDDPEFILTVTVLKGGDGLMPSGAIMNVSAEPGALSRDINMIRIHRTSTYAKRQSDTDQPVPI